MPAQYRRRDVEFAGSHPLDGFPSLSEFIASDHDRTSLVFRRFDRLAARNLLYLQSELAELEAKLVRETPSRLMRMYGADGVRMQDRFDAEDQSIEFGDADAQECAKSWEFFRDAAEDANNTRQGSRMELMKQTRLKLKEYSKDDPVYRILNSANSA
jgi:hypothetical protein